MADAGYVRANIEVMKLAEDGFKLSELTGVRKRVAERLIDRGRLSATRLPNGDFLVNKR